MEIRNETILDIDVGELGRIVKAGLESVGYKITGGITVSVSRDEIRYTPWGLMYGGGRIVVTAENPLVDTVDLDAATAACVAAIHDVMLTCHGYEYRDVILTADSLGITGKVLRRAFSQLFSNVRQLADCQPTTEMPGCRVGSIQGIADDTDEYNAVKVQVCVSPRVVPQHDETRNDAKPMRKSTKRKSTTKRK